MGSIPKESGELRNQSWDGNNEVGGEGRGLSEEDESRMNGLARDMSDWREVVAAAESGLRRQVQVQLSPPPPLPPPPPLQLQQQDPLVSTVRWERFLPLRSLKVLLVESDDSTRQVVSALLRNCGYGVTTAANGLQAWKILEDLTNRVDLVLTEVVMPCLSGIGLLCKIMNYKTCKNIPVIMMSSHNSMGMVFSCLSKGAVDFLVKPIRKNELKNLWQHVWRRCHSSSGSGSGSESGIQPQKSTKLKSGDESYDDTGSNDESNNASIGVNIRGGSDDGSGTQSSWTKRAIEVDSPQPLSPWDLSANPHDSTCAKVIHPNPETFCNEWVAISTRECQEQKGKLFDNVEMGEDLEIGVSRNPDIQLECYSKELSGMKQDYLPQQETIKSNESFEVLPKLNDHPFSEMTVQAANTKKSEDIETQNNVSKISDTKAKPVPDTEELLSLELRLRSFADGSSSHDDRKVLRHSDLSAFSRYNTAGSSTKCPGGLGGSNSVPRDNSLEAVKMESIYNLPSNSSSAPLNQGSNGSSSNNYIGSSTNDEFAKLAALKDKSASAMHQTSAFQPVQQCRANQPQKGTPEQSVDADVGETGQARGSLHQLQVQHYHHHYHHHVHHVHNVQQQAQNILEPEHDDLSLNNMETAVPQCISSNRFGGTMEYNAGNYSMNGSVSGSNHGSNAQNGSSTALNTGGMNMEIDNVVGGKSATAAGSENGSESGVNQNRFAQRVAALTKFRQKRKERCFKKKGTIPKQKKAGRAASPCAGPICETECM